MLPTIESLTTILELSNRVFGATCDGTQLQRLVSEATGGKRWLWQLSEAQAQEVVTRLRAELRVRRAKHQINAVLTPAAAD